MKIQKSSPVFLASSTDTDNSRRNYRYSKPTLSPAMAVRKALLRRIQKRALNDLRSLVPNLKNRRKPDEVTIVRETVHYIDQLEATILARLNSGSLKLKSFPSKSPLNMLDEIRQRFVSRHNENALSISIMPSEHNVNKDNSVDHL